MVLSGLDGADSGQLQTPAISRLWAFAASAKDSTQEGSPVSGKTSIRTLRWMTRKTAASAASASARLVDR